MRGVLRVCEGLAVVLLVVFLTSPAAAQLDFRLIVISDLALVSWFDPTTGFAGSLEFGPAALIGNFIPGVPQRQAPFICYSVVSNFDPNTGSFIPMEGGCGPVPLADIVGDGKGSVRINTDTSTNPDITKFVGNGGRIAVQVKKTLDFSRMISGVQQITFPGNEVIASGTATATSAAAEGFVILTPITGFVTAEMQTTRQIDLSISPPRP